MAAKKKIASRPDWRKCSLEILRLVFSRRALEIIGSLAAIYVGIVGLIYLEDERQDRIMAREIAAWSLLRDAANSSGNLGQSQALELLRSQHANLTGVNLKHAHLSLMDLSSMRLIDADMEQADVEFSILKETQFISANLRDAKFSSVDLSSANFTQANLQRARLLLVKLNQTSFYGADLADAEIMPTSSDEADFSLANLSGAQFTIPYSLRDVAFRPKATEVKQGSRVVRLLGGTVDENDLSHFPCFAWAVRDHLPASLPSGYAVLLVHDREYPLEACTTDPRDIWPEQQPDEGPSPH